MELNLRGFNKFRLLKKSMGQKIFWIHTVLNQHILEQHSFGATFSSPRYFAYFFRAEVSAKYFFLQKLYGQIFSDRIYCPELR